MSTTISQSRPEKKKKHKYILRDVKITYLEPKVIKWNKNKQKIKFTLPIKPDPPVMKIVLPL